MPDPTISNADLPTEAEMYDGPTVMQFPDIAGQHRAMLEARDVTPPAPMPVSRAKYVAMINAALGILGARLLGLIAVVGAVAMFGLAVWDPMPWRTYTVAAYAGVVLWPIVWLYLRRG